VLAIFIGLLRILVVLLLVRLIARFVAAVIRGYLGSGARPAEPGSAAVQLMRDPVCHTFVDPSRALTRDVDGRRTYYCSAACRDRSFVLAAAR
jgi:YHS domain-containing protein